MRDSDCRSALGPLVGLLIYWLTPRAVYFVAERREPSGIRPQNTNAVPDGLRRSATKHPSVNSKVDGSGLAPRAGMPAERVSARRVLQQLAGRLCWLLAVAACVANSAIAQEMTVRLRDNGVVRGRLVGTDEESRWLLQTDLFDQPIAVGNEDLVEAVSQQEQMRQPEGSQAFVLRGGERIIGELLKRDDDRLMIRSQTLGAVTLSPADVLHTISASQMEPWIASLDHSRFRMHLAPGWQFKDDGLVATIPGAAVVADFDLPERFRIRMDVFCSGAADFVLALGDRSESGAGEGSGKRRGASRGRLPSERFITQMEWYDGNVSLVRSNNSVSDAAVFRMPQATQQVNGQRLRLECLIDQPAGRMLAIVDGQNVGEVQLADEPPQIWSQLTLINRGPGVVVRQWDVTGWDGETLEAAESRLAEFGAVPREKNMVLLVDGSWLSGTSIKGTKAGKLLVQLDSEKRLSLEPRNVSRVVTSHRIEPPSAMDVLSTSAGATGGNQIRGRLEGSAKLTAGLAYRMGVSGAQVDLVTKGAYRVDLDPAKQPNASVGAGLNDANHVALLLSNHDRVVGTLVAFRNGKAVFRSQQCGEVFIERSNIQHATFGIVSKPELNQDEQEVLLTIPRSREDDPARDWLVDRRGDVLRGQLIELDGQNARIKVRDRELQIARQNIAAIVFIQGNETADKSQSNQHVIDGRDGKTRLTLQELNLNNGMFVGRHTVLGECRLPRAEVKSLRLGTKASGNADVLKLRPANQPKTFEE